MAALKQMPRAAASRTVEQNRAFIRMAPASKLHEIGIKPVGKTGYQLADGTEMEFKFGTAVIEFMGDITAGRIIFGPENCEPILGVTPLQSTGVTLNPKTHTLTRLPAIPLKKSLVAA
jgi:hypothetical protein